MIHFLVEEFSCLKVELLRFFFLPNRRKSFTGRARALCLGDESAEGFERVDTCPAVAHASSCYLGSKLITLKLSQPTVIQLCALMAGTSVSTCTNYPLGQIIYEMR